MKSWRRYVLTAVGLSAAIAALALIPPDRELLVELTSRKAASDLFSKLVSTKQRPLLMVEGPSACEKGVRAGFGRSEPTADQTSAASTKVLLLRCRAGGDELVLEGAFEERQETVRRRIPPWWSVLPPLLAIFIALGTKRLLLGLVLSIWLGALLHQGLDPTLGIGTALKEFLWPSVSEQFRLSVVVFTSALVGMVNVTTRAGGAPGVALLIAKLARGARSTRLATFLLGLALFFDDYANCIVVGSTMRPLSDKVRISREKLAYIVDSTSAPVAGVALLSTWIGYEVSLFDDLSNELALGVGGYSVFLQVLPARFYCFLALSFVLLATLLSRDFGPMLKAEQRAMDEGKPLADDAKPLTSRSLSKVEPAPGVSPWWPAAAIPVLVVISVTALGLVWDGAHSAGEAVAASTSVFGYLRVCLQEADGPLVLMLAALSGSFVAFALALLRKNESKEDRSSASDAPWHVAMMILLPLAVGLAAALMHSGLEIAGSSPWSGEFWPRLWGMEHTRVIMGGAALCSVLLAGAHIYRRRLSRRGEAIALSAPEVVTSWASGARAMALAIAILVLAWCIQSVCSALDTSVYLVGLLSGLLVPALLPVLVFLLAAAVAFSTGTSWGAMGILIPTVMPLAHHFGGLPLLLISAGAVLDGAIFGDHCSPISDTTVMSSVATGCDHLHHVRTQLPYALTTMGAAVLGYLALTAGVPLAVCYTAAIILLAGVLWFVGRKIR